MVMRKPARITTATVLMLAVALMALMVVMLTGSPVRAAKDLVVDQADLFTDSEESQLQASADELGAKYSMDIVIVTTNEAGGKTPMEYADDYFDYNGYGVGENRDGILMLIDFDNDPRTVWISTRGSGIDYLTDARIEGILDDMFANDKMANGDYYGAAQAFLSSTSDILRGNVLTRSKDSFRCWRPAASGPAFSAMCAAGTRARTAVRSLNTRKTAWSIMASRPTICSILTPPAGLSPKPHHQAVAAAVRPTHRAAAARTAAGDGGSSQTCRALPDKSG